MSYARFRSLAPVATLVAALVAGCAALIAFSGGAGPDPFMPHAHCYLFNRPLMMLHGWSDLIIGLSYVAISGTLTYLVFRARRELPFHWMMLAFALFIVACGATHFMEVWTLRAPHPRYWLSGWVKFLTASASLGTAVLLPPLVPKIRAILEAARLGAERKTELERAYAELRELYKQATAAAQPALVPQPDGSGSARDLAQVAKEVTVHARGLERARQVAEDANEAKDQFLAILGHELRTPLTPALAAASYLEQTPGIDPLELRESLGLIRRNIEFEARLVDDLLDITRITKGKLEIHQAAVDLHETIRHAVEMCQNAARDKLLEVTLHLDARERYVQGDGARLAQVVWNLILNAVKFTPSGGAITIRTANPVPGSIRVTVRDNGMGIAPAQFARMFEPFHQGEDPMTRRLGGIGLGLSIAKGLVEAHGGQIEAFSEGEGRGALFAIDLTTIAPPAVLTGASATTTQPSPRALRILLVEDHEDTRLVLSRLLTRWGHVVLVAGSVAEALACATAFAPELLLSDIGLPDGTGIDLLARLPAPRTFPAIAMSGYGMESDLAQTAQAGFDLHLVKPVSATQLKEQIDRLGTAAAR